MTTGCLLGCVQVDSVKQRTFDEITKSGANLQLAVSNLEGKQRTVADLDAMMNGIVEHFKDMTRVGGWGQGREGGRKG